jgi:hypothetical protein
LPTLTKFATEDVSGHDQGLIGCNIKRGDIQN